MSGLVTYMSSDDEGEEDDRQNVPIVSAAQSLGKPQGSAMEVQSIKPDLSAAGTAAKSEAPLIGPVAPTTQDHEFISYEEADGLSELPEKDVLRFLTPAKHPMTDLPESPPGSPNAAVSTKFKRFLELKSKGTHFNEDLAGKNAFKNPGLLPVMIGRIGMDEDLQYETSIPHALLPPSEFPESAYKEALLKSQQIVHAELASGKRSQSKSGTRIIDFESRGPSQL